MPLTDTFGNDALKSSKSIVPPTLNSTALAPQTSAQLPPNYTVANGAAVNASVPVGTQTAPGATQTGTQTAPAGQTNQYEGILGDINKSIQNFVGNSKSTTQLQMEAEQAQGVAGKQSLRNSLQNQLVGLNDQQTLLQLAAAPGGSIENQMQLQATGRLMTAGGLHTAAALRENQIQQNSLAAQSLSVKAAYLAANDDYVNAKDAAEKAAQLAFDAQEQQLKYMMAAQDNVKFLFSAQEKRIADQQQRDWQYQLQNLEWQRDDYKTGQALAINALKLNPNDPTAQYNAQQAMKLDPNDPQYLQKVSQLVGQYQDDNTQQAILERAYKKAQIDLAHKNIEKLNSEITAEKALSIPPTAQTAPYINGFNNAIAGMGPQSAKQATAIFNSYMNSGNLDAAKTYLIRTATSNLPADQQNQAIGRSQALGAMDDIQSLLQQASAKGVSTNILSGSLVNVANNLGTTQNPDLNYISSRIMQALITYRKAMTGVAFGPQEAADYKKIFPDITNIESLNTAKIQAFRDAINANNRATLSFSIGADNYDALYPTLNTAKLPSTQSSSSNSYQVQYNGKTYNVAPDGTMTAI